MTRPFHSSSAWSAVRSGGEQTNLAPSKPLPMSSSVEEQVLGAGLGEGRQARVAGTPDGVERLLGRQVDDVDGDPGRLCEA